MRKQMLVALFSATLVAGCGAPTGNNAATGNVTSIAEPNAAGDMEENAIGNTAPDNALADVLALNDRQRDGVFMRALTDAGIPCDGVSGSERLADRNGQPLWRATCKGINGTNHLITVTPDGIAHIISRSDR